MIFKQNIVHVRNAVLGSQLAYRPGHYYSPICAPKELGRSYRDPSTGGRVDLPGIDLNEQGQLDRLETWRPFISELAFPQQPTPGRRYYTDNRAYPKGDATSLTCFIRELRPSKIIEIGSGYSSACILDAVKDAGLETQFTFIDPEPMTAMRMIGSNGIIAQQVQTVGLDEFDRLESGDILLIDSSHILKTCSDVAFELFTVLPRLKPGVFVHIHDIFYPFEYPAGWVMKLNYSWNEIYAVRAFLCFNERFKIEFWNDFLCKVFPEVIGDDMASLSGGASLWLSVV